MSIFRKLLWHCGQWQHNVSLHGVIMYSRGTILPFAIRLMPRKNHAQKWDTHGTKEKRKNAGNAGPKTHQSSLLTNNNIGFMISLLKWNSWQMQTVYLFIGRFLKGATQIVFVVRSRLLDRTLTPVYFWHWLTYWVRVIYLDLMIFIKNFFFFSCIPVCCRRT